MVTTRTTKTTIIIITIAVITATEIIITITIIDRLETKQIKTSLSFEKYKNKN